MTEHGRETRSPNTLTRDTPHPRRGEIKHGGPFQRDDSGELRKSAVSVQGQAPGVMQDRGRRR
jgi:hypothetical protein